MPARTSRLETLPQQVTLAELATAIRRRTRDVDVIELCDRVLGNEVAPRSQVLAQVSACASPDDRVTTPRVTTKRRVTTAKAPRVTTLDEKGGKPKRQRAGYMRGYRANRKA